MKFTKRCIVGFLAFCLGMSLTLPCFATSISNVDSSKQINTIPPMYRVENAPIAFTYQNVESRADSVPTEYMNLSYSSYTAELLDLAATRASLTKYYFSTGTRQLNLDLELLRSGTTQDTKRVLGIYLYQKTATGRWEDANRKVAMTFYGTTATNDYTFYNLDPNKFYYISFKNESATSSSARMDISGTIVISE